MLPQRCRSAAVSGSLTPLFRDKTMPESKPSQTLEKYLVDAAAAGAIDHSLRVTVQSDGGVTFYIHPAGRDGQTLDFVVGGNSVSCISTTGKPVPHI
jgi:hypothetical protein